MVGHRRNKVFISKRFCRKKLQFRKKKWWRIRHNPRQDLKANYHNSIIDDVSHPSTSSRDVQMSAEEAEEVFEIQQLDQDEDIPIIMEIDWFCCVF